MSKMDIPQPVFTIEPSEPKPEPRDVLIGCIKVDIYSQSSGVTGNVNEDVIRVNTPSKQDIIGTSTDSQIPRLEGSKGTESPQQNDCQIFICEVCEEEFSEELFILNHKLVIHWMPIEMSLTHLPGHKTCGNCRKYLSDSVEPNVAVFLTKTCQTCISGKCYTCEMCTSHFCLSDHLKIKLKLKLLNPKEQARKQSAVPKHNTALSLTAGGQQMHQTQAKADVKSKRKALGSAKIRDRPLEQMPNQRKKARRKERIPKKKNKALCSQCEKTFTTQYGLTKHMRTHSDASKHHIALSLTSGGQHMHPVLPPGRLMAAKVREYTCSDGSESPTGFQPLLPTIYEQPATLNVIERSDHTKKPRQKEAKKKPEAKHQQNSTLSKNPTKKPRQKKAKIIRTKTLDKADVKSKRKALDSAKTIGTPLEKTPNQRKKERHMKRIPKKKDCVLCPQCGKTFARRGLLTKHLKRHSDERPFICDICNKSFKLQEYLKLHQRHHKGDTPNIPINKDMVLCSLCGMTFTTQDRLTKHMRTHSDERPFLCDVCHKSFMLEKYLKLHQRQHTGEKPFTCGECGRGFARRSSLGSHCQTHSKTKQFQCDICPQAFHRNADLQYHIRRHNGTFLDKRKTERRNLCDVCGKGFSKPYKLKIHLRNHTREFPYQCDACGKSFSVQYSLKRHIVKVHDKKTLPCPICGKMFPALVTLNRHRRMVHDAEKSFKCEECTMAFISQEHLDRHMYRHTGKSPHVCENCGRRFSTGTYCRAHQKKCY